MKLVLKPTSQETDVALIAQIHHWRLVHDIAPATGRPRQLVWSTPSGDASITYVDDNLLNLRYLQFRGKEREVAKQIQDGLEVVEQTDLQRIADPGLDPPTAVQLVNAAALMASDRPFDPGTFALFSQALRHPANAVRRAAIFAITYLPWRQFREKLLLLAAGDETLAHDVHVVVSSIDQHGWK